NLADKRCSRSATMRRWAAAVVMTAIGCHDRGPSAPGQRAVPSRAEAKTSGSAAALEPVLARWDRDEHADLRAVVVRQDGAIVAERYYDGELPTTLHDIRSAGKSITSLLAGIA